jgi:hypothetical protein
MRLYVCSMKLSTKSSWILNVSLALLVSVLGLSGCKSNKEYQLEGCWTLQSWEASPEVGEIVYPYGTDARGELCYNEGRVHLTLSHFSRNQLGTKNRSQVSDSLLGQAARRYYNYSGSYDCTDSTVEHYVEFCNVPDWEATSQLRYYTLKDDELTLHSPSVNSMKHTLIWKKK